MSRKALKAALYAAPQPTPAAPDTAMQALEALFEAVVTRADADLMNRVLRCAEVALSAGGKWASPVPTGGPWLVALPEPRAEKAEAQAGSVPAGRLIGYTSQFDLDFPFAYPNIGGESGERNIPVYATSAPSTPPDEATSRDAVKP